MDFRTARAVRIAAGESGLEIARSAGIDRSRHSLFENGSVELSDEQVESLRKALVAALYSRMKKLQTGLELLSESNKQNETARGVGARPDGLESGSGDDAPNHAV
jgi:transcriptional regulator with XRE-family HTH domain